MVWVRTVHAPVQILLTCSNSCSTAAHAVRYCGAVPSLDDLLEHARQASFVGRVDELAVFDATLSRPNPALLWVEGAGGAGKSTLLHRFAALAGERGLQVIAIDLSPGDVTPDMVIAATRGAKPDQRLVVLLDSLETAASLESWLREAFLPKLAADAIVVVASRHAPGPAWVADAGWSTLLRRIELENLDEGAATMLLARRGVKPEDAPMLARIARGHPLALVLLAEVAMQSSAPQSLEDAPDVVAPLVDRFVRALPGADHRQALQIAAHARSVDEQLLRAVVGDVRATDLFAWLRSLPFVTTQRHGVRLHELARDAIDADFRWRDAAAYRAMHDSIQAHQLLRLRDAADDSERDRAFLDFFYLKRVNPFLRRYVAFDELGSGWAERPKQAEHDAVVDLIAGRSAITRRAASHWFARARDAFIVVRANDGRPIAAAAHLVLDRITAEDADADPAMHALAEEIAARGALRSDEHVVVTRFSTAGHDDGRLRHYRPMLLWLTTPRLAFSASVFPVDTPWRDPLRYTDHVEVERTPLEIDGTRYTIFLHDWRRRPVEDWIEIVNARDFGSEPVLSTTPPAITRAELATAVHDALRNFNRADVLARSDLSRARAAAEGGVRAFLLRGIELLRGEPELAAVIDATFVRAAPSQERAAERLGMSFSTYRRRLKMAIDRLVEILLDIETHG